jgi:putative membrane protein
MMRGLVKILKGVLIGVANIIPGVSGGTMAVSMGIYDEIIGSITRLFKQFKKSILTLLPYAIGMVIAIVGLSFIIEPMFENYPLQTASLFVGLILGGLPIIVKKVKGKGFDLIDGLLFLVFFGYIIGLQLLGEQDASEVVLEISFVEVIKLFFIGIIASATMVIPGVSGSMILLILGYYNPIIRTINNFIKALSPFDTDALLSGAGILIPFGIGIVVGIYAIAKMIEFLLAKFEKKTYYSILGLVMASPVAIYMGIGVGILTFASVSVSVVTLLVGFVVAFFLGRE